MLFQSIICMRKSKYIFKGWIKNDGTEVVNIEEEKVTENVTYTAAYSEDKNKDDEPDENQDHFIVTWKNYDGTELEKDENVLVLEDEYEIGSDFFSMGEK